jgi:hypothetical protein
MPSLKAAFRVIAGLALHHPTSGRAPVSPSGPLGRHCLIAYRRLA